MQLYIFNKLKMLSIKAPKMPLIKQTRKVLKHLKIRQYNIISYKFCQSFKFLSNQIALSKERRNKHPSFSSIFNFGLLSLHQFNVYFFLSFQYHNHNMSWFVVWNKAFERTLNVQDFKLYDSMISWLSFLILEQ